MTESSPEREPAGQAPPAGWFPDPLGRYEHRYFNGRSWTSDVSDGGNRRVDPLGVAPGFAPNGGAGGSNGAGTAAVVMGSIALVIAWIPFVVVAGAVLAVLALVFGMRGLRRSRTTGTGRGASVAGLVMGGLGIGATVVGVLLTVVVWRAIAEYIEPGPVEAEVLSCSIDGRRLDVTGEITNLDDSVHDYTVFVRVDDTIEAVAISALEPGEVTRWDARLRAPSTPESCEPILIVNGPFPFDVELDPVG